MNERYSRHIMMPEVGESGQEKLGAAKVLVVGTGGLGSPVLYYLAAAGVGHIRLVDSDTVDITNLNRQFLHFEQDLGREKSVSASEKLSRFNPSIGLSASAVRLTEQNVGDFIPGPDVVISCVDNLKSRYLLNGACVRSKTPLVDGGVAGFDGYVMTVFPGITPCYSCIFPEAVQSPGPIGVLGATAGVVGTIMAMQAIKYLLGIEAGFGFLQIDLLSMSFMPIHAKRSPGCPVCGSIQGCEKEM